MTLAEDGGESRSEGEGVLQPCGSPSPEWSESDPSSSSAKRFKVPCPRTEVGGKCRVEGEGALAAAPACPAGVCVVAGDLLASCFSLLLIS